MYGSWLLGKDSFLGKKACLIQNSIHIVILVLLHLENLGGGKRKCFSSVVLPLVFMSLVIMFINLFVAFSSLKGN